MTTGFLFVGLGVLIGAVTLAGLSYFFYRRVRKL